MENFIREFKKRLRPWYYLLKYFKQPFSFSRTDTKAFYFDLNGNYSARYLYLLVKFLHRQGFGVYFRPCPAFVRHVLKDAYATMIFSENLARFSYKKPPHALCVSERGDTGLRLSTDFFKELLGNACPGDSYHFPVGMHPLQYHLKVDNIEYQTNNRSNTLFFSGNFNPKHYARFSKTGIFDMPNRIEIFDHLLQSGLDMVRNPDATQLETAFFNHQVVICNTDCCKIPHEKWRFVLSRMDFVLCMPGIIVPFCHNIVEAMSVGTVPVLHEDYANLFRPPLKNKQDCMTFTGLGDLEEVCENALKLPEAEKTMLRAGVARYYKAHLTPRAVVENIIKPELKVVYLQAEQHSLKQLPGCKPGSEWN